MDHHLIEGAAAIVLVIAGGFFVIASERAYARRPAASTGPAVRAGFERAELVPLIGLPIAGLVLILGLIALANAGGGPQHEGHGVHGTVPIARWVL